MEYLGMFSFDVADDKDCKDFEQGRFQCIVNAEDIPKAKEKFEKFLIKAKKELDCLNKVEKIYLHHIHEIKHVPQNPVLINFEEISTEADNLSSISCAAPMLSKGIAAFSFDPEEKHTPEHFLVF